MLRPVREHPEVAKEVRVRPGYQRCQAAHQGERFEDEVGRAAGAGPGLSEAVVDEALVVEGEALGAEGSAEDVTQEPFEGVAVVSLDRASCMEREAVHPGAEVARIDLGMPGDAGEAEGLGARGVKERLVLIYEALVADAPARDGTEATGDPLRKALDVLLRGR